VNRQLLPNPFTDDRLTGAFAFNPALDVPSVHQRATEWLEEAIRRAQNLDTPDGTVKIGILQATPGFGKTHVLGRVGHRLGPNGLFVFVPQMEEYGSPANHIQWHILDRLFRATPGQTPILLQLLAQLCQQSFQKYFDALPHTIKKRHDSLRERLDNRPDAVLEIIKESKETAPFVALGESMASRFPDVSPEVLRALALGWSPLSFEAWRWLRGDQLEEAQAATLNLPEQPPTATDVLQTLAALLKRIKMTLVVCCDQSEGFLRKPAAIDEMTSSLMGWLEKVPNLVLILSMLKDSWKKLDSGGFFQAFADRSQALDLDRLNGDQAVELLKKRLSGWPGARSDKGVIWPFREDEIVRLATQAPLHPRGLLTKCAGAFDKWLAKKTEQELGIDDNEGTPPIEDLFRSRWAQVLEFVRSEKLLPENLQEERLFRAVSESLDLMKRGRVAIGGHEILQLQNGALGKKYLSLQIKLGLRGSALADTVVVAVTKLTGGPPMGFFIKALAESIEDLAGSILVRPSTTLTLGPTTEARKRYDGLKSMAKLRPFELTEHRNAFEQMECYLRILDLAQQANLQLGQQTVTLEQCRELASKTQVLAKLDLFESVFCGWRQTSDAGAGPQPSAASAKERQRAGQAAGGSTHSGAQSPHPSGATMPNEPPPPKSDGQTWSDHLLRAVADKLIEFGQKVEPAGVELGPTFARLRFKPLGRTSIGKVRNHASDLRAHISGITTVPVISDQPGYISVDVRRPDRQIVRLADCLGKAPAKLAGRLAFPVGVDVSGTAHWLDLADSSTCHALVAGTTGSGKSEFLKSILAGLAHRMSPLELQFVLVDPKHVTFNFPDASPYLKYPVAHTIEEAMPLVQECFAETERRYSLLEKRGLEHVDQLTGNDALPRIVLVFDEFADLMAERKTKRELESSLKRIGALARAAGIHLVLATQRPDKDVVTPLLKANLPTRICLRVEGERNSKIILDEEGGEHLLGHGDLFWKFGGGMIRLQGTFVEKAELESLLRVEG
jgi:S-DNA-T family DNA segregation ATPase FtsK/SpoIIIE